MPRAELCIVYALCNENSWALWSRCQTSIILFIQLVCDIRQIDVNWKCSMGVLAWLCCIAWGERNFVHGVSQIIRVKPSPLPSPKARVSIWTFLFLFFFPLIFLSVLIYANNPLAHSLQADLSLIFSRDWKLILLLLVQPVLLGGQLNFIVTELYTTYAMHIYKYVIQIFIAPCTVAHATGTSEAIFWCTTQYIIKINVSII